MAAKTPVAVCVLIATVFGWGICASLSAQEIPAGAEVLPAPAPIDMPAQAAPAPASPAVPAPAEQPRATVPRAVPRTAPNPYEAAEQERRWAINRQMQIIDDIRRYNPWVAAYVPSAAELYTMGAWRAGRRAYRYGYAPIYTPWAYVPGGVYTYGYYPRARQPSGHERITTGPNSYMYVPRYGQPSQAHPAPAPAPVQRSGPREF